MICRLCEIASRKWKSKRLDCVRITSKTGSSRPDFPIPYLTWSEIEDTLADKHTIDLGQPMELEHLPTGLTNITDQFLPGTRLAGQLKPLMDHIEKLSAQGEAITIVSRQSARLQELWKEHNPFISATSL